MKSLKVKNVSFAIQVVLQNIDGRINHENPILDRWNCGNNIYGNNCFYFRKLDFIWHVESWMA